MGAPRLATGVICSSLAVLALASPASAQYLQFERKDGVSITWLIGLVGTVVGVLLLLYGLNALLSRFLQTRRQRVPPPKVEPKRRTDLRQRAAKLGFRIGEIKTLRLIAAKLAADDQDSLLSTDAGREALAADLDGRIRRRQREIEHLQGILGKLELMRDRGLHERATVRVETDLPIWIVERPGAGDGAEDEDEVYLDSEQISGRLVDISEGGAALRAALSVEAHDVIELWSADSAVWIPPVTGGVLSVQRTAGAKEAVYHLHFIDPPQQELRAAVQALQRQQASRL